MGASDDDGLTMSARQRRRSRGSQGSALEHDSDGRSGSIGGSDDDGSQGGGSSQGRSRESSFDEAEDGRGERRLLLLPSLRSLTLSSCDNVTGVRYCFYCIVRSL